MAINFPTPQDVAKEYLLHLKILKPEVNTDQTDSDWFIRAQVVGGVSSGLYGDQKLISDDAFPQSARHEALDKHLFTYFNGTFLNALQANGDVMVSGATGSIMPAGTQMVYDPNGNTYQTTENLTLTAVTGLVPVTSVNTGQDQNLLGGTTLTVSSPPTGFAATGAVASGGIADGRDGETDEEAAARILARIQHPIAGGTVTDYEQYAKAASAAVTNVKVQRFINGLGTVGVYITSGTTDIDTAINNGDAIVRIPSDALVQTVQDYIEAVNPITDCVYVLKPNEVAQDVTIKVTYPTGFNGSSIITGQTLTLDELVKREISRVLYKIPIGGRTIGATGFILASEIEEGIDQSLSSEVYVAGTVAQVLLDRQVQDLSASGVNRMVAPDEIFKPGTITVEEF